MRILYFAPHPIGPLTTGGRLRDYHLARQLARRCEVIFMEMRARNFDPEQVPDLSCFERVKTLQRDETYTPIKILRGLLGPSSISTLNYSSRSMMQDVAAFIRSAPIDTVQFEGVHLLSFLPVLQSVIPKQRIVADWHNIESELMLRYASRSQNPGRKLMAYRTAQLLAAEELHLLRSCGTHTVTSDRERSILLERAPSVNIRVIPNGVPVSEYPNQPKPASVAKHLLFVGSMDYHANVDAVLWFAREVWPTILRGHPDAEFSIVGRNPPSSVKGLAEGHIRITGDVADVRPYYEEATASVVPMRVGSGTRLKILESMAAGVPVVSTSLGVEGIHAIPGEHFLRADSAPEIVAAIDQIFTRPDLAAKLSRAARELVEQRYDWQIAGKMLYETHQDLMAR